MFLSGWAFGEPLHEVELGADRPGRAGRRGLDGLDDELGRPDQVGLGDHLVGALGVHQDLDAGDPRADVVDARRRRTGRAPSSGPSTGSSSRRASSSAVSPPLGVCGFHTTQSSRREPELEHGGVAAEVLVGQEQHLRVRAFWSKAHSSATWALDEVQTAPPLRPQNALMSAEEFM